MAAYRPVPGHGVEAQIHRENFSRWIESTVASINIAGFGDEARHNLYQVDMEVLIERAGLLGRDAEQMKEALPRLRGLA